MPPLSKILPTALLTLALDIANALNALYTSLRDFYLFSLLLTNRLLISILNSNIPFPLKTLFSIVLPYPAPLSFIALRA